MTIRGTIGFVGAGQMARALASGFVAADLVSANQLCAADPAPEACSQVAEQLPGIRVLPTNEAVVAHSDVVILAVKPQTIPAVLRELRAVPKDKILFISIVAGVPLKALGEGLQTQRVVRVMPNTPCLIRAGASAYALGPGATSADGECVSRLMSAVGQAFPVSESLLDAVTGLSGSGPAYVFTIIEALSDGGVRVGLPRGLATALAAQTLLGAAQMVLASDEHPGVLRDRVTSPGGTTIAGLQVLERHALRAALIDAVEAATRRSQELGQTS